MSKTPVAQAFLPVLVLARQVMDLPHNFTSAANVAMWRRSMTCEKPQLRTEANE